MSQQTRRQAADAVRLAAADRALARGDTAQAAQALADCTPETVAQVVQHAATRAAEAGR